MRSLRGRPWPRDNRCGMNHLCRGPRVQLFEKRRRQFGFTIPASGGVTSTSIESDQRVCAQIYRRPARCGIPVLRAHCSVTAGSRQPQRASQTHVAAPTPALVTSLLWLCDVDAAEATFKNRVAPSIAGTDKHYTVLGADAHNQPNSQLRYKIATRHGLRALSWRPSQRDNQQRECADRRSVRCTWQSRLDAVCNIPLSQEEHGQKRGFR